MRRYAIARFFAWVVVAVGTAMTLVGVVSSVSSWINGVSLAGIFPLAQMLRLGLGGVVLALFGFVALAIFDIAQNAIAGRDR